jgi:Dihydrodipicolinate synthase/N-acetylneuraminate lyase
LTDVSGIIVAMVTPLADDQKISYSRTDKLIDKLLTYNINGIFILGTNGEAYSLTEDEKFSFAKHVIEYVNHRTQILLGQD